MIQDVYQVLCILISPHFSHKITKKSQILKKSEIINFFLLTIHFTLTKMIIITMKHDRKKFSPTFLVWLLSDNSLPSPPFPLMKTGKYSWWSLNFSCLFSGRHLVIFQNVECICVNAKFKRILKNKSVKAPFWVNECFQERYCDVRSLALWLANSSELLFFLQFDRHLFAFSKDARRMLAESVQISFRYNALNRLILFPMVTIVIDKYWYYHEIFFYINRHLVGCVQSELSSVMPLFFADKDDASQESEETPSVSEQFFSCPVEVLNSFGFRISQVHGLWFSSRLKKVYLLFVSSTKNAEIDCWSKTV